MQPHKKAKRITAFICWGYDSIYRQLKQKFKPFTKRKGAALLRGSLPFGR